MIGDLSKSTKSIFIIAVSKLVCLLGLPFLLYLLFFYVHFQTLTNDGDGSSFMSSAFRSTLEGNKIPTDVIPTVGLGSLITLRHTGTIGGYLHSHSHNYETGSKQQQITLYPHLDFNNQWIIESNTQAGITFPNFQNITNGMKVKLLHSTTQCRLHSHDYPAPVSESTDWQKEVSCYGYPGFPGDGNDDWIVEIDQKQTEPGIAREQIIALKTKFRLKHAATHCLLFSHDTKLPDWGFEQQEVSCATQAQDYLTLWYVEGDENPILPEDTERVSYERPTFWQKFVESHIKMWNINQGLVSHHVFESLPASWPLLKRGISYWGEHDQHLGIYLLGNAVVWWSVTAFIGIFVVLCLSELIAWQVGKPVLQDKDVINFHIQVIHYLLGFAVHIGPSFLMGRQMFLHHYLPAYYFGILAFGHALDITATYVLRRKKNFAYTLLAVFFALSYYFFKDHSPIIYGTEWTKDLCNKSKWVSSWDYNCGIYLDNYEDYKNLTITKPSAQPSVTSVVPEVEDVQPERPKHQVTGVAPEHDANIDAIFKYPGPKVFKDQFGNIMDPERARKLLEEDAGKVLRVEQNTVKKNKGTAY